MRIQVKLAGLFAQLRRFNPERIIERLIPAMGRACGRVHRIAQKRYLRGPYPIHLRHDTGKLSEGLKYKITSGRTWVEGGFFIEGKPGVYGRIWELRPQGYFRNGTPKQRPFLRPALRDASDYIARVLYNAMRGM